MAGRVFFVLVVFKQDFLAQLLPGGIIQGSWAWEMPFLILYSLIAVIFSIASLSITICDYYSITKRDCQH